MPRPTLLTIADTRYVYGCIYDRLPRGGRGWYDAKGRYHPVMSLAWLNRHADDVHDLYVSTESHVRIARGYPHNLYGVKSYYAQGFGFDAILAARLSEGRVYVTTFASRHLLHDWLNRPAYAGRPVTWNCRAHIIGDRDYERLAWEQRQADKRARRLRDEHVARLNTRIREHFAATPELNP